MKKLPDYIIIGDVRCGTTSLYKMMIQHPQIVPAFAKELNFFSLFGKDDNWDKGIQWYISHLGNCKKEQITGEASPEYMGKYNIVPQRIKQTCPNAKLIIILRNPIDKLYSHFSLYIRTELRHKRNPITLSFDNLIKETFVFANNLIAKIGQIYLNRAIYINQLKEWLKYFPKEQFMIIKSEDMFKNPKKVLNEIFTFLNIKLFIVKPIHANKSNYSSIKQETKEKLKKYFEPYNKELYKLIGKNFNWEGK